MQGRKTVEENRTPSVAADVCSGAGIGLLLGVLVGLSVADVVASVVTGVVALLAAALGLASASDKLAIRPWRIGAFGFAAALALLLSLFFRAHDLLSPSPQSQFNTWTEIGFPAKQAADLVAYRELGILPPGKEASGYDTRATVTALYSADAENCAAMNPQKFENLSETIHGWQLQGGEWETLAGLSLRLSPEDRERMIQSGWTLACGDPEP